MNQPAKENPMLKAALEYHGRGWCIIPIPYGRKKAAVKWKQYQTSRPDGDQLVKWFENGKANIAVVFGEVSGGLTCLDFDELGIYERWKQSHPDYAAKLPTAQTSRGMHVYFRSTLRKTKKKDGLDIKASGYCILPPSLHPDGKTFYNWLIKPNGDIPELTLSELGIADFTEETEDAEETKASSYIASLSSPSSISSLSSVSSESSVKSVSEEDVIFENLDEKIKNYVKTAIESTLPGEEGYRNFLIFYFCRWLKGHSEFKKCSARQLKPLVKMWYDRALPKIGTKIFDDTWADFSYGWPRVKYPKGSGELKIAVEKALNAKKSLPDEDCYERPEVKLLIRICYELQELRKPESFWLAWGDAALILGVSAPTVGKWFSMLEADGIIKKTEEHTTAKATRYKFIAK